MKVINITKHLTGDLKVPRDATLKQRLDFKKLLRCIAAAARDCNEVWHVNDGFRSLAEQKVLYKLYLAGGTRAAVPGTSNHGRGKAADVQGPVGQRIGESRWRARACYKYGLCFPVVGEPWHIERA